MGKIKDILNKIWPWFQTTADKIQAWGLPPELKDLFDKVWGIVPSALQNIIFKELEKLYKEQSVEKAKQALEAFLKWFKEFFDNDDNT